MHDDTHGRGELELTDLTLQTTKRAPNHEHGGAIHNHGTISLERVAVIDSTSDRPSQDWGGGGITNTNSADATLLNVTIAGNSTNCEGGGIGEQGRAADVLRDDQRRLGARHPLFSVPTA